jgi:hypothetical protein
MIPRSGCIPPLGAFLEAPLALGCCNISMEIPHPQHMWLNESSTYPWVLQHFHGDSTPTTHVTKCSRVSIDRRSDRWQTFSPTCSGTPYFRLPFFWSLHILHCIELYWIVLYIIILYCLCVVCCVLWALYCGDNELWMRDDINMGLTWTLT